MSIDKTTLNRIRIAIQHALCSTIHDDVNYESMAKACVDLGIIEKVEDFDDETFAHSPILFEKLWEKVGDSHYKSPLELFEAWGKDEVNIYRLGDELEDFPESELALEAIFNALSDDEPTSNFLFVGEDFAKLYIDRTVAELDKKFHITEEVLVPVGEGVAEVVNAKFNSKVLLMDLLDMKYDRNFLEYLENLKRRKPNTSYFRAEQVNSLIELTDATGDMVGIRFDRERLYYVYLDLLERDHKFYVSDITVKINRLFKAGSFRIG